MNIHQVNIFEDGGNLTSEKLADFRSQLRPVGCVQKTQAVTTPVIDAVKQLEEKKVHSQAHQKKLRGKPQPKKKTFSPNANRPFPTPPQKKDVEKKNLTVEQTEQETIEELVKKKVDEKAPTVANLQEPVEKSDCITEKKLTDKRDVAQVKIEESEKPGFFKRSVQAISNFAKKVFYGIKNIFEAVFGKLFGRVTQIKVGGKIVTFDGHNPSKINSVAKLKVELDPETAETFKGISTIGSIAANTLPPKAPPLPADGIVPVKDWRKQPKAKEQQEEQQTAGISIKELVEKRRREEHQGEVFNLLAEGLAGWRHARHLDEDDDDDSFFEVTFTRDDGKKTGLSFDGDKSVEIKTEIVDKKPKNYSGLRKKQELSGKPDSIDSNVLAEAMKKLKKVKVEDRQTKQDDETDLGSILLAGFMRNAAHLMQNDD